MLHYVFDLRQKTIAALSTAYSSRIYLVLDPVALNYFTTLADFLTSWAPSPTLPPVLPRCALLSYYNVVNQDIHVSKH